MVHLELAVSYQHSEGPACSAQQMHSVLVLANAKADYVPTLHHRAFCHDMVNRV